MQWKRAIKPQKLTCSGSTPSTPATVRDCQIAYRYANTLCLHAYDVCMISMSEWDMHTVKQSCSAQYVLIVNLPCHHLESTCKVYTTIKLYWTLVLHQDTLNWKYVNQIYFFSFIFLHLHRHETGLSKEYGTPKGYGVTFFRSPKSHAFGRMKPDQNVKRSGTSAETG